MDAEVIKKINKDTTGLVTYEYMANHIDTISYEDLDALVDNMISVDKTGQFMVSTARYFNAIDSLRFSSQIDRLIKAAIDVDKERKYIIDLLASIWGDDYLSRVAELNSTDDNFRRIYKRIYNTGM